MDKIALNIYQAKDEKGNRKYTGNAIGIKYLDLVTSGGCKTVKAKRQLRTLEELEKIYAELNPTAKPTTTKTTAKAKGKK